MAKHEPWEESPFPGVDQPELNEADWLSSLQWFEREVLPDFLALGYTRGEALNAWQQQRIIAQLDAIRDTLDGDDCGT